MRDLIPLLIVNDVQKTVEYYVHKLGFGLAERRPGTGTPSFAVVRYKNVKIMFESKEIYEQPAGTPLADAPLGLGVELRISVSDGVGAYYAELKAMDGVEIMRALAVDQQGLRQFTIRDFNGYIITFTQSAADEIHH